MEKYECCYFFNIWQFTSQTYTDNTKHTQQMHIWCVRSILCSVSGSSNERNQLRMTIIQRLIFNTSLWLMCWLFVLLCMCLKDMQLAKQSRRKKSNTGEIKHPNAARTKDIVNTIVYLKLSLVYVQEIWWYFNFLAILKLQLFKDSPLKPTSLFDWSCWQTRQLPDSINQYNRFGSMTSKNVSCKIGPIKDIDPSSSRWPDK